MNDRHKNWDTWKGIAILAVVFIHASNLGVVANTQGFEEHVLLALRQPFNFPVAVFFGLAGYFSPSLQAASGMEIKKYLLSRCLRIWTPYLIWTIISISLQNAAGFTSPLFMAKAVFSGTGIGVGYFVIVLTQLIFIHPLSSRFLKGSTGLIIATLITLLSLGVSYVIRINYPSAFISSFPTYAIPFIIWFAFFQFGVILKSDKEKQLVSSKSSAFCFALLAAALLLSLVEGEIFNHYGLSSFASSQIKISSYLYSAALLLAIFRSPLGLITSTPFAWLGERSYAIYLSHMLFLTWLQKLIPPAILVKQLIPCVFLLTITVIATSSLFIFLAEKCLPGKIVTALLGIKKESKSNA